MDLYSGNSFSPSGPAAFHSAVRNGSFQLPIQPSIDTVQSLISPMHNADTELRSVIDEFDGLALDPLRRIDQQHKLTTADVSLILQQMENGTTNARVAASWILLNSPSALQHIDTRSMEITLNCLSNENPWQSTLHILQLLHKVDVPIELSQGFYSALLALSHCRKTFVRAWAISGLLQLPGLNALQTTKIEAIAKTALAEDAPSVKARIRRALGTTQRS